MVLGRNVEGSFALSGAAQFTAFDGTTLTIGDDTIWGFGCCIQTGSHEALDRSRYRLGSVVIGANCWLGNKVTILPGVELGDNVSVGANSVVTKSFPANSVIAGCPAVVISRG